MPWYLNDDGNGNDGKRRQKEKVKKSGTLTRISSRRDDKIDEKRDEKKLIKEEGEEEVAAGNKKKKWKNKFKRKRRRGKEDEEEKEDDDEKDEKRKKQKSSSSLLLSKAPSVSTNWHKLVARGDIKTSEKGKRRKRDFDAPLPSRSASASAKENYYDNDGNDAENECGRRGNDEDADDELRRPTPTSRDASVTETLAIDCEMVGVGEDGTRSVLARVTVVNEHGNVVLDTFVETTEKVTDYRTKVSGVRPRDLKNAPKFADVQKMVSKLIEKKIVVGHGLKNDFKALLLNHPRERTRDTALYHPLTRPLRSHERCVEGAPRGRGCRSLKELTKTHLRMTIQEGEHSSAEDARAALFLYAKFKKKWEQSLLVAMRKRH
jgi:RNA exonuclease 4